MAGRRASYRSGEKMVYGLWLAFTKAGDVRMTINQPSLAAGERAVSLSVELPLALFATPSLSAILTVDTPDPAASVRIDVAAAEAALRSVVGCDVTITVNPGESD